MRELRLEQDRIAATVEAAASLPGVDLVVVVDDGSTDATGRLAAGSGARVDPPSTHGWRPKFDPRADDGTPAATDP